MRKFFCAVLASAMCLLCGCEKKVAADKYTLVMNGEAISTPVTVESLGKDYSVSLGVALMYKGEIAAGVMFDESSAEQDELKRPVKALVRNLLNDTDKTDFSIGGIKLNDTKQDVLNVYGQPTYKDEPLNIWKYCKDGKTEDDYWLGFQFDDPNDPERITSIFYRFI